MCIEIGNKTTAAEILESQVRYLTSQEKIDTPGKFIKVRCPCLKNVLLKYAYRCLYCEIFYCKECAEQHFGKTVAEYRAELTSDNALEPASNDMS